MRPHPVFLKDYEKIHTMRKVKKIDSKILFNLKLIDFFYNLFFRDFTLDGY